MPRPPPQGGPPQVMHNDPRAPRPDWNRPPGNVICNFFSFLMVSFHTKMLIVDGRKSNATNVRIRTVVIK